MALAGDLSEFPLTDIIQLVQLSKQTGGVQIHGLRVGQPVEGWLYFRDGKIIGAASSGMAPLDAVYTFFTLTSGPFMFHEDQRIDAPTITISNEVIIMEGIMRQDAWMRIHEHIPSLNLVPRLVLNPTTGSAEINLEPEEWRILTMVNGKNSIAQIAQRSGLGEFRACEIMAQLLQNGLVEVREPSPGETLAPEFERIAASFLGAGASALLEEAYRLAGVSDPSRATSAEMMTVVDHFERGVTRMLDAPRAHEAAAKLRVRAQELSN
ncbi:MAG: DUF4388 domain-containing protein [Candidatus Viridilinea halotolerans]|uniref:DUF4388 domain-containing protein n=1 Tax=Candidatus Viridilinea halotolerans TaxID=2491704 RepID=A0A426UC88_9CHLR|nr:MAG: DUF4388 domain-containing protein [Candidatus Viridilinea halotolerans]